MQASFSFGDAEAPTLKTSRRSNTHICQGFRRVCGYLHGKCYEPSDCLARFYTLKAKSLMRTRLISYVDFGNGCCGSRKRLRIRR